MKNLDYSIVVPVYNEKGNITKLDQEIRAAMSAISDSFEIIYINDGSNDGSLEELKTLTNVKIIDLNRNYGQATALDAGFKMATGEIVISIDGDGQNDPADFAKLLQKMREGNLDVVAGWRKDRKDKKGICLLTLIGKAVRRFFIKDAVNDSGCTLRAYKKEAVKSLDIGGEMHRYVVTLLRWKGFKIGEVIVNDRLREHGKSKYNYTKAIRGLLDLLYVCFIYKFSQRPLHFFGYMSLISFVLAIASGLWTIYDKTFLGISLNRNGWFYITTFLTLSAIVLFSFGIVIDLLIKIHLGLSHYEKRYYIREVIEK
ncbi:MAG TPA: glycosyltransferase family 2 protein [Candidatus Paceibacterota bacterium]|nr:glycosyltransferase family 2 protein [Candidatus Paceibacterota bacterium]HRZ34658.1 glycosyltransferase family 2 protein [Candidatus Paceibacterota bacterium]